MPSIDKSEPQEPLTFNERWWFNKIKQIITRTGYGSVELDITLKAGKVEIVKEHTRKSYNFNND